MTFPTLTEGDAWTANYHNTEVKGKFEANPPHILTAAGDLPVATGAGSIGVLPIGTNTQMIESRSSEATGRKWVDPGTVPVGGIVAWNDTEANVPSGWHICDGTDGTPDLRDRFILGAGSTYAVGASGGASVLDLQHSHTLASPTATNPTHSHTQPSIASSGAHVHSFSGNTGYDDLVQANTGSAGAVAAYLHNHTISGNTASSGAHTHTNPSTSSDGSHSHTLTPATTSQGLSATQDMRPPFYSLYFIMRVF